MRDLFRIAGLLLLFIVTPTLSSYSKQDSAPNVEIAKQVVCNYWAGHLPYYPAKLTDCRITILEKGNFNNKCGWAYRLSSTVTYIFNHSKQVKKEENVFYLKKNDFNKWTACRPDLDCGPFGCN